MEKKRGFAALTPEQRKVIATMGGRASVAKGTAHRWTSEEAKLWGRKGGSQPKRKRPPVVGSDDAVPEASSAQ